LLLRHLKILRGKHDVGSKRCPTFALPEYECKEIMQGPQNRYTFNSIITHFTRVVIPSPKSGLANRFDLNQW